MTNMSKIIETLKTIHPAVLMLLLGLLFYSISKFLTKRIIRPHSRMSKITDKLRQANRELGDHQRNITDIKEKLNDSRQRMRK